MASSSLDQQSLTDDLTDSVGLRKKVAALERKNQMLSEKVKQMILIEHQLYASQAQLDSQVRVYRKLYALGQSLNKTFDLAETLALASQFVIYELEFERCLLLMFDPSAQAFEVKAFDGYYDDAAIASADSFSLSQHDSLWQRLAQNKDYEICAEQCAEADLCEVRSPVGMDEYIVFALRQESEAPLGLLIAGNTAERFPYHTRVTPDSEGFLGLANAASQLTTAINSVGFYQALTEERSLLEKRVQSRTQDLNSKNESLQVALQELKLTQGQLIQSEKMSGLGQMVAGIAHEINNPVSFIYGNLQHAQDYAQDLLKLVETYQTHCPDPHPKIQDLLEDIELDFLAEDFPQLISSMKMGATRIEKIVLSLRNFSRMDEADMKQVNIHEGIDSTLLILDHKLNGKSGLAPIEVVKCYSDLPEVECYAGALNQVFMNVLANAVDAITSNQTDTNQPEVGKITVTTTAHNDRVVIAIADNGSGISAAVIDSIFNPFFTTKPVGQGTGMGLSISYQIVCDRHKGRFFCESEVGQGTCFFIELPTHLTQ